MLHDPNTVYGHPRACYACLPFLPHRHPRWDKLPDDDEPADELEPEEPEPAPE